ncbi:aspartic peptidase domain-containing protein [Chaetomium tenue]|uniref:Aspartic peptidase domain-containing protein n=1 Tax=Chaetomium tenue TaxID=1854479 RepID=A0ACB7P8W3_9PEZI|nr:aspartic peptidase domain-containing protein [Chaetomium globosum]
MGSMGHAQDSPRTRPESDPTRLDRKFRINQQNRPRRRPAALICLGAKPIWSSGCLSVRSKSMPRTHAQTWPKTRANRQAREEREVKMATGSCSRQMEMRLLSTVLLALVSGASSKHVVQFNVTKGPPGIHVGSAPTLARRETFSERLINNIAGGGYYVKVKVGTPGQDLTMLLDTGSSDAWVLGHDADLCTDRDLQSLYGMPCADTYNPDLSSSEKMIKRGGFKITYLDGGTASGDYITDDFSIGGTTIKSLQMAYVTKAVRGTGILGLGFSISERASTKYPNIMDEMSNQGLIQSKAYSLYLNDRRTDAGSLLFGGIDTDKFIGPLEILPLYKPPGGNYSSFEMAQPIHAALSAIHDADLGMTLIDCDSHQLTNPSFHLTFTFTPTSAITIPLHELILDILPPNYLPPQSQTTNPKSPPSTTTSITRACVLGIQSTAQFASRNTANQAHFALLGDTFLRSAYVVYDLAHYQIGLAQANLNSTTSTVVELSSSTGTGTDTAASGRGDDGEDDQGGGTTSTGLPRLTGVAAQQTTFTPTSTPGGIGGGGDAGGVAGTGPEQNAAGPAVRMGRIPVGEMAGVAAVTGIFALLGGALIVF